jgi:hypothetical protein
MTDYRPGLSPRGLSCGDETSLFDTAENLRMTNKTISPATAQAARMSAMIVKNVTSTCACEHTSVHDRCPGIAADLKVEQGEVSS